MRDWGAIIEAQIGREAGAKDGNGFVWVCHTRELAKQLEAACEQTENGTSTLSRREGRFVACGWVGPRWIIHCMGLSPAEYNAMQRVAVKLDPRIRGRKWDWYDHRHE